LIGQWVYVALTTATNEFTTAVTSVFTSGPIVQHRRAIRSHQTYSIKLPVLAH